MYENVDLPKETKCDIIERFLYEDFNNIKTTKEGSFDDERMKQMFEQLEKSIKRNANRLNK